MLHNCDAGEYSVLTTYGNGFVAIDDGSFWFPEKKHISVQYVNEIGRTDGMDYT